MITTNNKQQTTNNKQQTTNNKQQTTNNKQQTPHSTNTSFNKQQQVFGRDHERRGAMDGETRGIFVFEKLFIEGDRSIVAVLFGISNIVKIVLLLDLVFVWLLNLVFVVCLLLLISKLYY